MFQLIRIFIILMMTFAATAAHAKLAKVNDLRMWSSDDSTRLVIDLSRAAEHRLNTLKNPES